MHERVASNESLWILTAAPGIWAAHFMLSYLTGAIWCAKFAGADGPFVTVRTAIAVFTVVAIAGIGLVGWSGFRHHRRGAEPAPHDADSPEDRDRFVGLATLLLAALSAVATVYSALAAVFIESCY